jgi:putative transposase
MRNVRRFYLPDAIVFVTLVTKSRLVLFDIEHPQHAEWFLSKLRTVRQAKPFRLLAYALLPDHGHVVLLPTGEATFSSILLSVQRSFTFEYKERYGAQGTLSLWQPRFWDHLIRDEKDLNTHLDYTHWNAVRHGLVSRPEDWPYSSYRHWLDRGCYEPGWGHIEPKGLRELQEKAFGE